MSNKEKIINLFYNEHLKPVDIALKLGVSNAYVSKVIKKDFRYHEEKNQRKQQNKQKHKEQTIKYMKLKQKSNRDSYETLKAQLKQDAEELSYYFAISDRSFRKFNASAYKYNAKRKRFEIDKRLTVSIDVPKANIISYIINQN